MCFNINSCCTWFSYLLRLLTRKHLIVRKGYSAKKNYLLKQFLDLFDIKLEITDQVVKRADYSFTAVSSNEKSSNRSRHALKSASTLRSSKDNFFSVYFLKINSINSNYQSSVSGVVIWTDPLIFRAPWTFLLLLWIRPFTLMLIF